jgi:hypothetical protein
MSQSFGKKYEGHDWIKVPAFKPDPSKTVEENYDALMAHHVAETTFLIDEIRSLAYSADYELGGYERADGDDDEDDY